nr:hypothetical protein [Boldiaceae sp.]
MKEKEKTSLYENNEIYDFEYTRPTGWSVTCLDETIFYYVDCNYVNMCNINPDKLNRE